MSIMTEQDHRILRECWEKSGGKGWVPKDPTVSFFDRCIAAGYLRRTDARCMFEAIKDGAVAWTEAGRVAMQKMDTLV